ncbi:MAG: TonB-dependent receptor [bacterium]|nr:TonB-dependent receptor [bacterium]
MWKRISNTLVLAICTFCFGQKSVGQESTLKGTITELSGDPIPFVKVVLVGSNLGTIADEKGKYEIPKIPTGTYFLEVRSSGYITRKDTLQIGESQITQVDFILQPDLLNIGEVVVSGTRSAVERYNSPVITNTISSRTFEATQSLSIAEGLSFSPGLRVENNCQNCGFTQLRMNGLEGAYSQVLINSRPVFSALAGVYGLEMLPTGMVDRVEVVRGGGSVLYGGNAIAGTVNIITKDPVENSFELGVNQAFINGQGSDRTINMNGSIVSEQLDKGITFFGFNRMRDPWDANGDGISEIVKLENNTFGFDAFWNIDERNKLKLGSYFINEFRRGGSQFDLLPHQTDVTEQLDHAIISSNVSYEHASKNLKHKVSLYGSLQAVDRESYYGGGGSVLEEGDSLTADAILALNAYGNSNDISLVGGAQYNYELSEKLLFIFGSEYIFNDVRDEMPGYNRLIDQRVGTIGNYAQVEYKPINKLTFLLGGRFDNVNIQGVYDLDAERFENNRTLNVPVPRFSAMYEIMKGLKARASFAQGYRGPQAFDEDLHLETVGGAARFIRINPDLKEERSNSAQLSLNYDKIVNKWQMNFVAEGFYTELINPFILSDQYELPSGVSVINKRNGAGAMVAGTNLEANVAFGRKFLIQSGVTLQTTRYAETEEIWAPEDPNDPTPATVTDKLLRTPNAYGYFSVIYKPIRNLMIAYSGTITGAMDVPHVIDIDTEQTILERTPTFFDNNIKVSYDFQLQKDYHLNVFGGVQNIFNSYQNDFDMGANRDAGYVYGPMRPRTFFMGIKFGLN